MQTLEQLENGQLVGATHIKIAEELTQFPNVLFSLVDTLEILDLSNNRLSSLPTDFDRFKKLRILFLSNNLFTEFPTVLSRCENLEMIGFKANFIENIPENSLPLATRWLILTQNKIQQLPNSIGNCNRLQKLMLAGNCLTNLPTSLQQCKNLQLLRISANQLFELPKWLYSMPHLAWLAFAGNPFSYIPKSVARISEIDYDDLQLKELLGQGASGIISKAILKNDQSQKDVAVKVFKGEVTSDGLPKDEMLACLHAGEHQHLVKILGKIINHPEEKDGLVMELMDNDFTNLANPPSFETCTRDVFLKHHSFSIDAIFSIIQPIASVAFQLHKNGVMHGDLYAHNILINKNFEPLFGDFGAASLYNTDETIVANALQKIEVKAFGCLLDDLLQHVNELHQASPIFHTLCSLRDRCMMMEMEQRPSFSDIIFELEDTK